MIGKFRSDSRPHDLLVRRMQIMRKKRILCVEDHQDMCELITRILDGYKVIGASGMQEALRRASSEKFDLYLLDQHLSDGTGTQLSQLIREFDTNTPILFVTGTSSMSAAQASRLGAQGVIRKGSVHFIEELRDAVDQLMSGN
jgi:CheY-like chemotaxis protein